jgi:uncharacterized caspase-like protein
MGRRREALLVGVEAYDDERIPNLAAPVRDVENLADVLGDPEIGAYEIHEVLRNPTEVELRREIGRFFHGRASDDSLLFYFAGHGLTDDDGRLYFGARDTEDDHPSSTGTAARFLVEEVESSRAGQVVLLIDCCYGARIFDDGVWRSAPNRIVAQFPLEGKGRVALAAAGVLQHAYETPTQSYLTAALLAGLRDGAADRDGVGFITFDDLADFVEEQLRTYPKPQRPARAAHGPALSRSPSAREAPR